MSANRQNLFSTRVDALRLRVDACMNRSVLARLPVEGNLADAIRYTLETDGKRIRPLLCYAAAELSGMPLSMADLPAVAIELIHTYSLVHDDLPAMDDDDLRRGKPTVHKVYDDAMAILVGDALQAMAFEVLAGDGSVPDQVVVNWVRQLADAAGARGMVLGQTVDLAGETRCLNLQELEAMHLAKTGALIRASLLMPLAGSSDAALEQALLQFGLHMGLAFQIRDDILDVEASTEDIGKPAGSDVVRGKSTFVSLLGLNESGKRMRRELDSALACLHRLDDRADGLRWIAGYIVDRRF